MPTISDSAETRLPARCRSWPRRSGAAAVGAPALCSIFIDASSNTLSFTGVGVRGQLRPSPPVDLPHVVHVPQHHGQTADDVVEPRA